MGRFKNGGTTKIISSTTIMAYQGCLNVQKVFTRTIQRGGVMGDNREGCIEQIRLEHGCNACAESKFDPAKEVMYCELHDREWSPDFPPETCDDNDWGFEGDIHDYDPDMDRDEIYQ